MGIKHRGRAEVAARRGELGMTQQDLADKAGVDLKTIYNLESGTRWPIARTRVAVSAALKWEGDALAAIRAGSASPRPDVAAIPSDSGGTYAEVDEVASILYAPLIQRRLDDLKKDGDPRPTGEAMFLEDGDALGAGAEVAAGLANAWSLAMGRGLDLDRAVKYAARAWALDSAYRARQAARSTGQNGALVRR